MRGGVVLCFDDATDQAVRALWAALDQLHDSAGNGRHLPPHITLLGADDLDSAAFAEGLATVAAQTAPFPIYLGAVASFFGPNGVLYLAPSVTPALAALQQRLLDLTRYTGGSMWEHFVPGRWMPHCTLAVGLAEAQILQGMAMVRVRETGLAGSCVALLPFTLGARGAVAGEALALTGFETL